MSLIELKNICLSIGKNKILENVSITIQKGSIVTLIGPNGGGKTSIARIILGVLKQSEGEVKKSSKMKLSYMPQKITIDKTIPLSTLDFLRLTINKKQFDKKIFQLAERLELDSILNQQIHNLSGGQLQKISFLRAISTKCDLLVLDEPTQFMDIPAINEFYKIIEEFRKEQNCSILLISHDLNLVMQKTDFVFCINKHVCCHGTPEYIDQHPKFLELFDKKAKSLIGVYNHKHDHDHRI